MSGRLVVERRYRFSASHLYRRSEWSEAENRRRFGKCANLPGHGHNYRLFVTVSGPVDPLTGFLIEISDLDALVGREILDRLDHQHLNSAVPEFADQIPSSENLLLWIQERLASRLGDRLVALRLEEDEDLAAEWRAGPPA